MANAANNKLFEQQVQPALESYLRDTNPWWAGKPARVVPDFRRWMFEHALQRLENGLAPVTVLRGPRQVGKTTIHEQIIQELITRHGVNPNRILRVQFDELPRLLKLSDPVLLITKWFEGAVLGKTLNEAAHANEPAFLFFDEVQNLASWAPQIKALADHNSVRVMVTGSSALRIEQGRDSLAGRITTLELGPLLLREIAALRQMGDIKPLLAFNGLAEIKTQEFWENLKRHGMENKHARDISFAAFSERGGYPVAQVRADRPWNEIADQLNETVIKRVIQHDLRMGERGRKRDENLLEEVFRLCCRYAGQAPGQATYIHELHSALGANLAWQRVLAYLKFMNDSLLVRIISPLELRLKRKKGSPKLCLNDHSLRSSWLQETIPLTPEELDIAPHLADLAGHIAESVVGGFLCGIPNLDVAWFPERPTEPEVDFVLTIGEHRIPVEVKYRRRIDPHKDTVGLRAFMEKTVYNAPFGVLVTLHDDVEISDPRIITLPLSSLLLMR